MNASDQKKMMHRLWMLANYQHRQVLDLKEREKLIRKDLERVLKSKTYSSPDTPRSG